MKKVNKNINDDFKFLEDNKEFFYAVIGFGIVFFWNANDLIQGDLKEGINYEYYKLSFIFSMLALGFQSLALSFFMLDKSSLNKKILVVYTFLIGMVLAAASFFGLVIHAVKGLKIDGSMVSTALGLLMPVISITVIAVVFKYRKNKESICGAIFSDKYSDIVFNKIYFI